MSKMRLLSGQGLSGQQHSDGAQELQVRNGEELGEGAEEKGRKRRGLHVAEGMSPSRGAEQGKPLKLE